MKSFIAEEKHPISGRGTVYLVVSPAGEQIPELAEQILLDGKEVEVAGVELRSSLMFPREDFTEKEIRFGLLVRTPRETQSELRA